MKLNEKLDEIKTIFDLAGDNDNEPRDIVLVCRQVLEKSIDIIYESSNVKKPYNASLLGLINSQTVQSFFDNDVVLDALHYVRIVGINALHEKHIKSTQAKVAYDNTRMLLELLEKLLDHQASNDDVLSTNNANEISKTVISKSHMNESQTRKVYIDTYLGEAGWEVVEPKSSTLIGDKKIKSGSVIPGKACCEIPVKGFQNASGIGFCDYVLYGKDGKPLAIVEAKKTSVSASVGMQQVREYGKCMFDEYGYTPILYYTNGYDIYIVDGKYPDRKITAFHTHDELSALIQKRDIKSISDFKVRNDIAGRPYQTMAITSMLERFNQMHRRGLLVMATGTGKTRTAIALVEILSRNNWIRNVLFLADRTSLVRQAFKNFSNLLPDMTYQVLSDKSLADEPNARIVFSTHQTMINYIDADDKKMSVGRFDLIIIDEAHRSIFNKYGAIFDYFDSLLIGLTATPKDEVDANTYALFNCESGVPNYSYSMEEAIKDHYLVPYKLVNRTSKLLQEGIKYSDLSDEDKAQLALLSDAEYTDDSVINGNQLFKKLYNKDTCRKVLDDLMTIGLRVHQGQVLGKSIIFAVNHFHAELIVKAFNEMYPMYPDYCKLIDNQVKNSENLIQEFEDNDDFRIAVSVDMLDTGIDIPSVLNLVFFKHVNSNIKLIQMIGRGTRLCAGLIDGQDKKYFYILDYFSNLKDTPSETMKQPVSIYQKLFEIRLNMLCLLQTCEHQTKQDHKKYYNKLKKSLISDVQNIKKNGSNRISVREVMSYVDKYHEEERWQYISALDEKELNYAIKPLVQSDSKDDYLAYSFDFKMLQIEKVFIKEGDINKASNLVKSIRLIAQSLLDKASITEISEKIDDLNDMYSTALWSNPSIEKLEYYRLSIRHLMKYLKVEIVTGVEIDHQDETLQGEDIENPFGDIRTYKEKVMDYLFENSNNPTILKIKNIVPLTNEDFNYLEDILWVKLGTKEDYYSISKIDNLAAFIRSIIGLDQQAINKEFSQYLNNNVLTAEQQEFIYSIINYVRENGDIETSVLIEESPFDYYDLNDLFDNEIPIVIDVVNKLHNSITL